MLLKNSFYYVLAKGLPGLVNFAALALYTRLLAPEEYGRYALLITGVGLMNVMVFQWLRLVAARFLQAQGSPSQFLGGILAQFYVLATLTSVAGLMLALLWPDPIWQKLLALAVPLLVSQAFLELSLVVLSARQEPGRYGILLGSKTVIALTIGALLAWIGLGAVAPVWGLIFGQTAALALFGRQIWRSARIRLPEAKDRQEQLGYGLPLIFSFALAWLISGSDRLLLALFLNEDAVGHYSAGYDLAFQSITLLLTIVNTAAYPLAVKALERGGEACAREQLAHNGELIIAVALTSAAGLVALAPAVLTVFIGEAFRPGAAAILPIVAAASALSAIKAFHFDIAFHLGKRSTTLVWITAFAAVINVVLNLLLIPRFGAVGAAWATLAAYAIALVISAYIGHRVFSMPSASLMVVKGCVIAFCGMLGFSIPSILNLGNILFLPVALFIGSTIVFCATYFFNTAGMRHMFIDLLKKFKLLLRN